MDEMFEPPDLDRRAFLKAAGSSLAAGLLSGPLTSALGQSSAPPRGATLARGVVFHDTDGSGHRTPEKAGIAGVLVSNGRQIVRTAADGRYELPVGERAEIFVIKPSGWMVPVSALQLPQFYYLHRPTGSPAMGKPEDADYIFPNVAPTGPLPASIDFPLRPQREPEKFRVLVFGDTQPGNEVQLDWMARDTIAELQGVKDVAFGLTVGDLVNVGRLQFLCRVNELQAMIGVPWLNVPGNHDLNFVAPNQELSFETFKSSNGPTTYAWEYGAVSFLMLTNVFWKGYAGHAVSDDPESGGEPQIARKNYEMAMAEADWEFLAAYIATVPHDRLLVVAMHMNLVRGMPVAGRDGFAMEAGTPFTRRFLQAISGHPRTLSISGHTHRQAHYFLGREHGFDGEGAHHHWNTVCVRGSGYRGALDEDGIPHCVSQCGTPNGYSFLSFDGNRYAIDFRASRRPVDHQMNIYAPSRVAAATGEPEVLVNIFAGSERSTVEMRAAGGKWIALAMTYRIDPGIAMIVAAQLGAEPWVGPPYKGDLERPCEHLWVARIPARLPLGMQLIDVRTTDMFGQTFHARRPIMVVENLTPLREYPENLSGARVAPETKKRGRVPR